MGAAEYRRIVLSIRPLWMNRLDELHLLTPLRILAIIVVAIVLTFVLRTIINRVLSRTLGLVGAERTRAEARQRALASALRSAVVGIVWGSCGHHDHQRAGRQHRRRHRHGDDHRRRHRLRRPDLDPGSHRRDVRARRRPIWCRRSGRSRIRHWRGRADHAAQRASPRRRGPGLARRPRQRLRVANLSKSSLALLDLEVARDSDLGLVDEVAARLCRKLGENVSVAATLTGPPTIVGLTDVRDDRLIYRLAAPTLPGRHDEVRRAWRTLVLGAFREGALHALRSYRRRPPPPTPSDERGVSR